MCGLVGVAGNLAFEDETVIKKLLVYDFFRGPDSTGIATIPQKEEEEPSIVKIASHPFDLMDMSRFKKAVSAYTSHAFIGHNRAATQGKVNGANAHPFKEGHIVGAHNGTLTTASFNALMAELRDKYEVDSQAIFAAIAKFGIEKTVPLLQGAWALVWYDLKARTINFIRNSERPLWYAFSKDLKRIFWASEYDMMALATKGERHSVELFVDSEGYRFFKFEVDTLHSFHIDEFYDANLVEPVEPITMTLKGKPPVTTVATAARSYYGYGGGSVVGSPFHAGSTIRGTGVQTATTGTGEEKCQTFCATSTHKTKTTEVLSYDVFGSKENPYGDVITDHQFALITLNGCAYCSESISYGDTGITIFLDDEKALCRECSGNKDDVNRFYTSSPVDRISTALTA